MTTSGFHRHAHTHMNVHTNAHHTYTHRETTVMELSRHNKYTQEDLEFEASLSKIS